MSNSDLAPDLTPEMLAALRALPRCPICSTPKILVDCPLCRAVLAEKNAGLVSGGGQAAEWLRLTEAIASKIEAGDGGRMFPLGFHLTADAIRAAQGKPIRAVSQPQFVFRGELLVVPPECPDGLLVDVKVGNRSQMVNDTLLPISLLCPKNWADPTKMPAFGFDTAAVAQDISLFLQFPPAFDPLIASAFEAVGNPMKDTDFRAVLWGRVVGNGG